VTKKFFKLTDVGVIAKISSALSATMHNTYISAQQIFNFKILSTTLKLKIEKQTTTQYNKQIIWKKSHIFYSAAQNCF
jgi:hypothetical protein